jgi:hypothetical protein
LEPNFSPKFQSWQIIQKLTKTTATTLVFGAKYFTKISKAGRLFKFLPKQHQPISFFAPNFSQNIKKLPDYSNSYQNNCNHIGC